MLVTQEHIQIIERLVPESDRPPHANEFNDRRRRLRLESAPPAAIDIALNQDRELCPVNS